MVADQLEDPLVACGVLQSPDDNARQAWTARGDQQVGGGAFVSTGLAIVSSRPNRAGV